MNAIAFLFLLPLLLLLLAMVAFYAALSTPTFVLLVFMFLSYKVWRNAHHA